MSFNRIPSELQALKQWVCWSKHSHGAGGEKRPLNANTPPGQTKLEPASVTGPSTWASFTQAMAQVENGRATGVGFVFSQDDEYSGIDLDHCIHNGIISDWAVNVVRLLDSYTEISPSGHGIHILVKGANGIPKKRLAWHDSEHEKGTENFKALEVDSSGRYHRVTGDLVDEEHTERCTIQARGPRLSALLTRNADKEPILATAARGFDSNRNDAFMALAGLLRNAGHDEEAILACLTLINQVCNHPPAPAEEIEYIAKSACRYEPSDNSKRKERAEGMPILSPTGSPVACLSNALYLLPKVPSFSDLWFNEFDQSVYSGQDRMSDTIIAQAKTMLEHMTLISWHNKSNVTEALSLLANQRPRHPVRDYLRALTWDGTPRLNTWLQTYTGNTFATTGEIGRVFLTSAVARVMVPGCEVRQVLLLTGPQNIGKSKLGAVLATPQWFTAGLTMSLGDKDALQALWGIWIAEMPELSSLRASTVEAAKAFISRSIDKFRAPYAHFTSDHPRQCVIIATSNDPTPLKDTTGNSRFLPVHCLGPCDVAWLIANRDQLWAEATQAYSQTRNWWELSSGIMEALEATREDAMEEDVWKEPLQDYFDRAKPNKVSLGEVLYTVFGFGLEDQDYSIMRRAGRIITSLMDRHVIPYKRTRVSVDRKQKWVYSRLEDAGPGNTLPPKPDEVV